MVEGNCLRSISLCTRSICVEMRGHGDSEKPDTGYKVQRLTTDVHDVLQALDLSDVVVVGHSMGSSIMWCYWDLFGSERLGKLILVDQSPFLTGNPAAPLSPDDVEIPHAIAHCDRHFDTGQCIFLDS